MRNCAIYKCVNNTAHLKKWKAQFCETHNCNYGTARCTCDPPFKLFPFPSEKRKKDVERRRRWTKLVNRKTPTGQNWEPDPKYSSRICSIHFPDGEPTERNPDPVLHLGYELHSDPSSSVRPLPKRGVPFAKKKRKGLHVEDSCKVSAESALHFHLYTFHCDCRKDCDCKGCFEKQKTIHHLQETVDRQEETIKCLEQKLNASSSATFSSTVLSASLNDSKKVKAIAGVTSKEAFNDLHTKPKLRKIRYWQGGKK